MDLTPNYSIINAALDRDQSQAYSKYLISIFQNLFDTTPGLSQEKFRINSASLTNNGSRITLSGTWNFAGRWSDYGPDLLSDEDTDDEDTDDEDTDDDQLAWLLTEETEKILKEVIPPEFQINSLILDEGTFELVLQKTGAQ